MLHKEFKITATENTRVSNVLSVLTHIFTELRNLKPYTLSTNDLSEETKIMRKALLESPEPDILLFKALPEALGL